jgi:hypothetical protein
MSEVPDGDCPNHAAGVLLPEAFAVSPLQDVD